jgi:hypothetical protein
MKKFSKKGVVLFAGVMAVCAFVLPAMSSAASWGVIGTEHTLHSPDVQFTTTVAFVGAITSQCTNSTFTVDVRSAAALTVTSATFRACTATGPNVGTCTVTANTTPHAIDWNVTGITTSDVRINSVHVDVSFENHPGSSSCNGLIAGQSVTITGTLGGGQWTGNGANQHEVIYANDEGLSAHSALLGTSLITVSGTFRDTQQTGTLT